MLPFMSYFIITLSLITSLSPCKAEVYLTKEKLTVDIHNTTMNDVLEDIRHQGHFTIVALEETKIGNVRISKKFWNLPLEAGLARLLTGWNYGINRNESTGKISTLYLVSQRTDSSSVSPPQPHSTTQQSNPNANVTQSQLATLDETHDDSEFLDTQEDEEYDEFLNE